MMRMRRHVACMAGSAIQGASHVYGCLSRFGQVARFLALASSAHPTALHDWRVLNW